MTTFAGAETWDPARSVTFDAGVHVGYTFNSQGTALRKLWRDLSAQRLGSAAVRATPPGQSGSWLYQVSGPYSGFWVKEGAGVHVQP